MIALTFTCPFYGASLGTQQITAWISQDNKYVAVFVSVEKKMLLK